MAKAGQQLAVREQMDVPAFIEIREEPRSERIREGAVAARLYDEELGTTDTETAMVSRAEYEQLKSQNEWRRIDAGDWDRGTGNAEVYLGKSRSPAGYLLYLRL